MSRIAATFGILTALLCATGCTQIRFEAGESLACHVNDFTPDASDDTDVMNALGPPTKITRTPHGFAFLYEHIQTLENQFGLSVQTIMNFLGIQTTSAVAAATSATADATTGAAIAGIIRILYAWQKGEIEVMAMEFDHEGSLKAVAYSCEKVDMGHTIGVSFIFSAQPKVPSEGYKDMAEQHDWGRSLLQYMPKVLNYPQDPTTGASGLQRRPSGFFVGQDITIPQESSTRRANKRNQRSGYRNP